MDKKIVAWGAAFALFSVILGAFGAHALKEVLTEGQLSSFETGVRHQMYHGFALLLLGFNAKKISQVKLFYKLFVSGTLLFSISIYLLSLEGLIGVSLSFLGPITPIGGLCLIIGWSLFLYSLLKK